MHAVSSMVGTFAWVAGGLLALLVVAGVAYVILANKSRMRGE